VPLQTILLVLAGAVHALSIQGIIPDQVAMADSLRRFFQNEGLPAVGLVSFVESLVVVNLYFPGSVVILLAMSLAGGNLELALVTYLWIVLPSALAHAVNYGLGRFGATKIAKLLDGYSVREPSLLGFVVASGHPHTAALASVSAGWSRVPVARYFSRFIPVSMAWCTFWAILMYNIGWVAAGVTDYWIYLVYAYLILWMGWDLWRRPTTRIPEKIEP
jgi:membrane protein DedA with SNARE-associated domain